MNRYALIFKPHAATMENELSTLLNLYPTTVNYDYIIDVKNFDERLSAINCLVVNTVGVSESIIEFVPDNEPPLEEEIICWIWLIRPDLSKDLLNLKVSNDFRILLNSYINNNMSHFWKHIT